MEPLSHKLACAFAIALLALPATAAADPVVPPENSAATQYTEAIPTGGGQKDAGKAGNRGKRSPSSVLGSHKAKKLESEGRTGREVAEVVAETAPAPAPEPAPEPAPQPRPEPQRESGGDRDSDAAATGASQRKGDPPGGARQAAPPATQVDVPAGSSGLAEVLAQATGVSATGALGGLLPLLVLATLAWALAYAWRQRQRPA